MLICALFFIIPESSFFQLSSRAWGDANHRDLSPRVLDRIGKPDRRLPGQQGLGHWDERLACQRGLVLAGQIGDDHAPLSRQMPGVGRDFEWLAHAVAAGEPEVVLQWGRAGPAEITGMGPVVHLGAELFEPAQDQAVVFALGIDSVRPPCPGKLRWIDMANAAEDRTALPIHDR